MLEAPAILSGPTKVKDIISHFRSEMSAIVAQAGDESRLTLTRAYELMDDLLKSLEVAYANALDKTFADLDAQQQKAFQDAAATLEKFDASVKSGTDAALQISTDVNTTVYEIAAWADTPLVTKRGPVYVEPRSFGDPITFTVSGFKLGRGHPRLLVNGQAAQPGNFENNELSFVLPRSAYPSDPTKVIQVQARLTVFKSPGWWCIVCRDNAIEYAFTQYVLPEDLGTYQHVQQIHEKKTAKQPYISDWVDTGETQTSNLPKTQCFEPTKGRRTRSLKGGG